MARKKIKKKAKRNTRRKTFRRKEVKYQAVRWDGKNIWEVHALVEPYKHVYWILQRSPIDDGADPYLKIARTYSGCIGQADVVEVGEWIVLNENDLAVIYTNDRFNRFFGT